MSITDNILDAIEILAEKKVSGLQFNKTVRGKIAEIIDESIGKYKIQYQNSYFTAYSSDLSMKYYKGTEVYVEILSNDFEKNALIIGTVQKLGINYIDVLEEQDKYVNVGQEIKASNTIAFQSYKNQNQTTNNILNSYYIGEGSARVVSEAAARADALKVMMTVKTNLPYSQQSGGNYGLKITAKYKKDPKEAATSVNLFDRVYQFDINNMVGQPYNYTIPSNQYTIFEIEKENFYGISAIEAFCDATGFPEHKSSNLVDDIWISNISLQFVRALTEEELTTSSLKILTPQNSFFNSGINTIPLQADIRIKGKKVNFDTQEINIYWAIKNNKIKSDSTGYSSYCGIGWELLNTETKSSKGAYQYQLAKGICLNYDTQIKCVAVFANENINISLSDTISILNDSAAYNFIIQSESNYLPTILTLKDLKHSNISNYDWTFVWNRSINGETESTVQAGSNFVYDTGFESVPTTPTIYSCSVYDNQNKLIGSASILLKKIEDEITRNTLLLKNGTQIFKYNECGAAPTSDALAESDKMVISALSFEVYDTEGKKVDLSNNSNISIKWIWPLISTTNTLPTDTMLVAADSTFVSEQLSDGTYQWVYHGNTLLYKIKDVYDPGLANTEPARNNIRLEVIYDNEVLITSTDFVFTKEGELGTNGTKYFARIVPKDYDYLILRGPSTTAMLYGLKIGDNSRSISSAISAETTLNSLFNVEFWDGSIKLPTGSYTIAWSLAATSKRSGNTRLSVNYSNSQYKIAYTANKGSYCCILQATITYNSQKFYATYPVIFTSSTGDNVIPWILNGYQSVMYESDGTRSKYTVLPFRAAILTTQGIKLPDKEVKLAYHWTGDNITESNALTSPYDYTIEPLSRFISEDAGQYIRLRYKVSSSSYYYTYLPIELYLNRYGMAAMNDWDGNSIQISDDGGYILAPQVGAGSKDNNNRFTGITIGEVFQSANNKQIGLFGYHEGAQSIFLDAETGNATFGKSGNAQIQIQATGDATLQSGDYNGTSTGLKIKLSSTGSGTELGPYIKYGSGNFIVDSEGNLTANNGTFTGVIHTSTGSDAGGWVIDTNDLHSTNSKIYLDSSTPKIYGQTDPTKKHNSLTSANEGFYLAADGLSIGSKFHVDSNGKVSIGYKAATSNTKHWTIDGSTASNDNNAISSISYGTKGNANSVYLGTDMITLGSKFKVSASDGTLNLGVGAVSGKGKHWILTTGGTYTDDNNDTTYTALKYGTSGSSDSVYLGTDKITLGNRVYIDKDGVAKFGHNAAGTSGNTSAYCWEISSISGKTSASASGESQFSYIKNGVTITKDANNILSWNHGVNSVYLGTNKLTLGTKFYVDNTGTLRLGYGAVDDTGNHWSLTTRNISNATHTALSYGTVGNAGSVYLGTDQISLGAYFSVTNQGELTAKSGSIADWTIGTNELSKNDIHIHSNGKIYSNNHSTLADTSNGFYLGSDGISLGGNFSVSNTGKVTAKNIDITGGSLNINNGNFKVDSSGNVTLAGSITWNSSSKPWSGDIPDVSDYITSDDASTIITDTLVASPTIIGASIQGGQYHDVNSNSTLDITTSDGGHYQLKFGSKSVNSLTDTRCAFGIDWDPIGTSCKIYFAGKQYFSCSTSTNRLFIDAPFWIYDYLIGKNGKNYGSSTQRDNIDSPSTGQIFFVI